ncbi:Polysaccharide biosynthesis/export protein [Pigmentiphaga humi]|uniref:Polysaccharide biosynthesis/export protein n=1 Tax=Pigmentiphaga humi TaxID=2478468 RepID=A0A3P4B1D5_9BURK|nr:polysaccharide biosynthesis/export family protein [Pigmentiphaga humi]VCU70103.1 Polysaccharide biosynthesis/export protein [Pigmentiphaga humi]
MLNSLKLSRAANVGSAVVLAACLGGCSLAPGPYLGVSAPTLDETDRPYVYDEADASLIEDRADIFAITPSVVAMQVQEREKEESANEARRRAATVKPIDAYQYLVGPRDVLRITVWNHPELNNPAGTSMDLAGRIVDADGTFFYPYAGQIKAAGRTVQAIRAELTKKLSKVLVEPQVDVSVADYRSQRAFVLGQVAKPGVVPITDVQLTITDIISQAGGLQESADLRRATLQRGQEQRPVDLFALFYSGDVSQNFPLQTNDVLTIPENRYNKIFVMGDVLKQQSLIMPRGRMSLAEALSDAGGFDLLSAKAGNLYVIREGANQRSQIWHLNASSPDAMVLADRFDLKARDVVYVDPAAVARFGRVVKNIIPSASLLRASAQN